MLSDELIWLIISILLFIIEAATVNLFTIWFGLGAICAMIVALAGGNLIWQILVFAVVSVVLLAFTRPLAKKLIKKTPTNSDSLIGKIAVVTQRVDNLEFTGEVKIDGKFWTARSVDDSVIEQGETVEITEISGVKLIVKIIKEG